MILHGDCIRLIPTLEAESVDAIVTDPPYGLSFMGKKWDYDVPSVDVWRKCLRVLKPGGHLLCFAGTRTQHRMAVNIEDAGFDIRDMIAWVYGSGFPKSHNLMGDWDGWGTALKPALEPITVARKPFKGTVANNVLAHGTGGLNIDGCRVGAGAVRHNSARSHFANIGATQEHGKPYTTGSDKGRWPANLIHDGSEEVTGLLNGAARFFYCPKAGKVDRGSGNNHPTVKPTDLMRYLCRLVTPPGGTVLDPFAGSGSTGKACALEGFEFICIEREREYVEIAKARVNHVECTQLAL
jgi:hypothetical protein